MVYRLGGRVDSDFTSMNKPSPDASNPRHSSTKGIGSQDTETYEPPDHELVRQCQDGNLAAFEELVTRYRGKVYAMILNMVKSEADAWDLSQEAFIKAWKALPRFEARSSFYTWLYRITHNVTYDWLRKQRVRAEGEFDESVQTSVEASARTAPRPQASPDEKLSHMEIRERIEEAIQQLSPEHRAVILLKEVDGHQYNEIAEIVGCSIGTVMSRLFYARKKLQSLLKDLYETNR